MNTVVLIGRLVAEPEIRHTQAQKCVASYRLAVDRQGKKDGQPSTDFINCVAWGSKGEFAQKFLHKGTKIAVIGRIQTGSYKKNDGSTVYTTDVIVEHQEFCESKQGSPANTGLSDLGAGYGEGNPFEGGYSQAEIEYDDGLPF